MLCHETERDTRRHVARRIRGGTRAAELGRFVREEPERRAQRTDEMLLDLLDAVLSLSSESPQMQFPALLRPET